MAERNVKQMLIILVLVAVAVAVGILGYKKAEFGGVKMPHEFLDRPMEYIDIETGELMTLSVGKWQKLGRQGWKFKNPDTGEFTMVSPIVCRSCGEKVPPLNMPEPDGANEKAAMEYDKAMRAYMCPQCGRRAY